MSDKIKVEVELDVSDLHRYVQTSEDDFADHPVSITEAVVAQAAAVLVRQVRIQVQEQVQGLVAEAHREVVKETVQGWVRERLDKGVQRTNDYGDPTGVPVPLGDIIKVEITRQLQPSSRSAYSNEKTVLSRVIEEQVNRQLATDLQAAFATARGAMLQAAQDAGAQALRAAVTKAVGA